MNPTRAHCFPVVLVLACCNLLAIAPAGANPAPVRHPARHLDLINATFDSVTALAIAPAGSANFHDVALGQPLQGGLTSMTFDVPAGDCLRDIRVTFKDQRSMLYPHFDVCRHDGLRLAPPRNDLDDRAAVASSSP